MYLILVVINNLLGGRSSLVSQDAGISSPSPFELFVTPQMHRCIPQQPSPAIWPRLHESLIQGVQGAFLLFCFLLTNRARARCVPLVIWISLVRVETVIVTHFSLYCHHKRVKVVVINCTPTVSLYSGHGPLLDCSLSFPSKLPLDCG